MAARTMRRWCEIHFQVCTPAAPHASRDVALSVDRRTYNCNVTVGLGKTASPVVVPPTTHTLESVLKHVSLRSDEESA